jgi:hypothetical protein
MARGSVLFAETVPLKRKRRILYHHTRTPVAVSILPPPFRLEKGAFPSDL